MTRTGLKMTANTTPRFRDSEYARTQRRLDRQYDIGMLLFAIFMITIALTIKLPF